MRPPYGSKLEHGALVVNPGERTTVQMVTLLRGRGASYRMICWELLKAGHRPRSGGEWHANQIRRMATKVD